MLFIDKLFKRKVENLDSRYLPAHIAIIMDGNGRWAKKRGLPRNVGHREGSNALRNIVIFCNKIAVKYLTVYAFSTENWKRPKSEVDALMALLVEFLKNAEKELSRENVRIKVMGDIQTLPAQLQSQIMKVQKMSSKNTGLCLNIALNYGGRDELIAAVKAVTRDVVEKRLAIEKIDGDAIAKRLYTSDIPDPDLLIRTSGEIRISNFLLWQLAYTEFWFTDVLWPDFKEKHLIQAITEYQNRHRRFGGV